MKKTLSYFIRYVPVIIASIYLIIGCSTAKNISPGQISRIPNWKNLYYFHAGDSIWIVKPVPVAGNQFSGMIFRPEKIKKNRQVHIYADPLSAVIIDNGRLSVPMDNITKVENYKISAGSVITAVAIVTLLFLTPVFL
jgi:hypothetical protein